MISKRKVIISLAVNFSLLWVLSLLFWMVHSQAPAILVVLVPVAPIIYSFHFLALGDLNMALVSLLIIVLTFARCLSAILKPNISSLFTAHTMLVVYFCWGYHLIGIGV